mmetsp:Transcript_50149/g.125894  ORF Transcript_50149/g.125894 Transcript_50149/m.125894 type:complete len:264 (+) Transcript_50149:679-1470(+)
MSAGCRWNMDSRSDCDSMPTISLLRFSTGRRCKPCVRAFSAQCSESLSYTPSVSSRCVCDLITSCIVMPSTFPSGTPFFRCATNSSTMSTTSTQPMMSLLLCSCTGADSRAYCASCASAVSRVQWQSRTTSVVRRAIHVVLSCSSSSVSSRVVCSGVHISSSDGRRVVSARWDLGVPLRVFKKWEGMARTLSGCSTGPSSPLWLADSSLTWATPRLLSEWGSFMACSSTLWNRECLASTLSFFFFSASANASFAFSGRVPVFC